VQESFVVWLHEAAARHLDVELQARAVVAQVVVDAAVLVAELKAASMEAADAEAEAAAAHVAQVAEAEARKAAQELAAIRSRAAFILKELQVVDEEAAEQARAELVTQTQSDVDASWEAERARVGEAKRAEFEAQVAAVAKVRGGLFG